MRGDSRGPDLRHDLRRQPQRDRRHVRQRHAPGTPASDSIFAFGGNDTASGLAGNDCFKMGDGNDVAAGQEGNDTIYG